MNVGGSPTCSAICTAPDYPPFPFELQTFFSFHIGLSFAHSIAFLRQYQQGLFKLFLFLVGIVILGTPIFPFCSHILTFATPILASIFFNELTDIDAFDDAPIISHTQL